MREREMGERWERVREMGEADSPKLFFLNPGLGDWKKRHESRKENKRLR